LDQSLSLIRRSTFIDGPPVQEEAVTMLDVGFNVVVAPDPRPAVRVMPRNQPPLSAEMLDKLPLDPVMLAPVVAAGPLDVERIKFSRVVGRRDRDHDVELRLGPGRRGRL